jgi:hypothetical protein
VEAQAIDGENRAEAAREVSRQDRRIRAHPW